MLFLSGFIQKLRAVYNCLPFVIIITLFCNNISNAQQVEDDDVVAIFQKSRPSYNPKKIRAGAFEIGPKISIEERYDDNIYRLNQGEISDYATLIKPAFSVNSNWNRNALNFYGDADVAFYSDREKENYEDYTIGTKGQLEVLRKNFISADINFKNRHENRGTPESYTTSLSPTEYDVFNTNLGFDRKLHKLALKLNTDYKSMNYYDGFTNNGTVLDNDRRDRKIYTNSSRLSYEFIPNYQMFINGSYNVRVYDVASSVNRDSEGFELTLGTEVNITGKAKGEIFAGYMKQEYKSTSLKNINAPTFGTNILWNITGLTSLRLGISRSINETVISNSSGYIGTTYSFVVEHELLRNLLLGLNTSLSNNDYQSFSAGARQDDIGVVKTKVKYLINRNLSVELNYQYYKRDTNIANQDYTRNTVSVGLTTMF